MESVSSDLFHCNNRDYLILCDRFSGMIWVTHLKSLETSAITKAMQDWFLQLGFPFMLISDNGPQYRKDFDDYCHANFIRPIKSSPYKPNSNGLAENSVNSAKKLLQKCKTFSEFNERLLAWRNTPSRDSERSPAQRFFNRRQRFGLPVIALPKPNPIAHVPGRSPLASGEIVRMQDPITKLWDSEGKIIRARESGRSYELERQGKNNVIRNNIFLKRITPQQNAVWQGNPDSTLHTDPTLQIDPLSKVSSRPAPAENTTPLVRRGTRARPQVVRFQAGKR